MEILRKEGTPARARAGGKGKGKSVGGMLWNRSLNLIVVRHIAHAPAYFRSRRGGPNPRTIVDAPAAYR